MIPWTHTWADLRSIGVSTTEQQRFTVENGGQVLAIRRLPAIQECGCGDDHGLAMADVNGDPMMIPFVMHATNPLDLYTPGWKMKDQESIAYHLEAETGRHWRYFPSYVGVSGSTVLDAYFDEEIYPQRVWSGIPLVDEIDRANAEDLIRGFQSWLGRSAYEAMQEFMSLEGSLMQGWGDWDPDDPEDETTQAYWELRKALAGDGYIVDLPDGEWALGAPIDFDPIEQHVTPPAAALWRSLLHQSRFGSTYVHEAIPAKDRATFEWHEKEIDPWY